MMMVFRRKLLPAFWLGFFLLAWVSSLSAYEYGGVKLEYLNSRNTNFYGMGFFVSNRRFDAELNFFLAEKLFTGADSNSLYPLYYASFDANFHFLRAESLSFYVGTGIMPLLPKVYSLHLTGGVDFFWSEDVRVFLSYRMLINNAAAYHFPFGSAFSAGMRFNIDFMRK